MSIDSLSGHSPQCRAPTHRYVGQLVPRPVLGGLHYDYYSQSQQGHHVSVQPDGRIVRPGQLGVDLWTEHVLLVLAAMQEIAAALGLDGQGDRI